MCGDDRFHSNDYGELISDLIQYGAFSITFYAAWIQLLFSFMDNSLFTPLYKYLTEND